MAQSVTSLFEQAGQGEPAPRRAHVIAVTSGKGGVGKTNITTNLAISLAKQGKRVCIFDADTGLANINILLGLTPKHTLEAFLDGTLTMNELLLEGPRGVRIVPGASGIAAFANLDRFGQQALLNGLQQLETQFDYLLIDTAAGIADGVIRFVLAAEQALLVVSPDPTSLTDAFALTRVLKRNDYDGALRVVVNMAESRDAARKVFLRFSQAVEKYLQIKVDWFGHVRADRAVVSSVRLQHPVVLVQPESPASRCFDQLAMTLQQACAQPPTRGLAEHLRAQEPETAVSPADRAMAAIRNATPSQNPVRETNLGELNRVFVDCIQGSQGSAEELVAAIKPIIDAYVARFHAFPLDMREAIYRYLEVADFPDQEIRNQVMLLEQLYEKRYQRPLMDKEDSLFRLLNQVRNSEPEFADAIARLQHSYERQYRPGPQEALATLLEKLRAPDVEEADFAQCIDVLRQQYLERFGREHRVADTRLREQVAALLREIDAREDARAATIALLTSELEDAAAYRERLRALLDDAD